VPRKGYCLVIQPELTDYPAPAGAIVTDIKVEAQDSTSEADSPSKKTDLWITIGVIALIVAGMLLGAGITRLWIGHFDQPPVVGPWL
jgi:hypothetical protein